MTSCLVLWGEISVSPLYRRDKSSGMIYVGKYELQRLGYLTVCGIWIYVLLWTSVVC